MRRPTRTRRRASAVFRFLPSPLHPKGTKLWRTKLYRWRQGRIFLHRWSVKITRKFTRIFPIFNALRVKVKGEGKKCELRWVRDAQARVRLGVPTHARGNRRRSEKKRRGLSNKRSRERHKTREHSKESPLVFINHHHSAKKIWKLFRKNFFYSKQKIYLCVWINTTFPFPAALRRPYSAKQMNYRPHNQRTRSLTYWKIPTFHQRGGIFPVLVFSSSPIHRNSKSKFKRIGNI